MEMNIQPKKARAKKMPVKAKAAETDPFATAVEQTPVKKSVVKKAAPVKAKVAPVKTLVKKAAKEIGLDPFAEVVEVTSPVRKQASRSVAGAVATGAVKKTPVKKAAKKPADAVAEQSTLKKAAKKTDTKLSPVFKALADVSLPELPRENRARLQMQTPTRLYFYWSVKENPWALLKNVFGDDLGSYSLVLKLIDNKYGREEIHQTDAAGNYWFNVEPDSSYQAEI
ncbi:MAG: hypothetical protein ABJB40_08010, partial [Acidobacteriota bacterium]